MPSTRDYYYHVDNRGVLTLDGVVQDDPGFVDFFYRRLAATAHPAYPDYPFVSRCGDELNYLRPADTPIVYTSFDGERLFYAATLSVPFYADRLTYSEAGVLYYDAPVGGWGRVVPSVAVQLAASIQPWGPFFAYRQPDSGRFVPVLPRELEHLKLILPRTTNLCVGCGAANEHGLGLSFVHDTRSDEVFTYVTPDMRMQGSLHSTHGGFVSLLLDETMGKCLSVHAIKAPTAQLNVRFRLPMLLGVEHEIRARLVRQTGRKNDVRGTVRSTADGSLIAEAEALFITIRSATAPSTGLL